ncbi:MAG: TldD/PmbA family protein [Elusimicrobia bacterium]|nr:TldD/PmbA family protein [Elusimicrobiota bacterium]
MSFLELGREIFSWVESHLEPGAEAELYLSRAEERGIELRQGRLEGAHQSSSEGLGLRVLAGGKMGFACAGGASVETARGLLSRVMEQMPHLETDPDKVFPEAAPSLADTALEASLWDESLFTAHWEKVLPQLEAMQSEILAFDKRINSVLRLGYGESRGEVSILNSCGVAALERGGSASVGFSALAKEGEDSQVGSAYQSARHSKDLDFRKTAKEGAWRSAALLGARKLPTGRRSVVFDPWVAGEILDLVAGLLCADQVQRGKSLLAGKIGKRVACGLVTFVDDPRRLGGSSSSLYDDEGCPTARKIMIDRGMLQDYFYDSYTAHKEGRRGNASAGRGSYKGLPGPSSTNFYLAPGSVSREQIISDTKDGILVLDVMGMHMADPISGEFSVGVSGISIERGRLGSPVKSAMISGNLLEILGGIDAVGNDLAFYGSLGSPTFRVAGMSVA